MRKILNQFLARFWHGMTSFHTIILGLGCKLLGKNVFFEVESSGVVPVVQSEVSHPLPPARLPQKNSVVPERRTSSRSPWYHLDKVRSYILPSMGRVRTYITSCPPYGCTHQRKQAWQPVLSSSRWKNSKAVEVKAVSSLYPPKPAFLSLTPTTPTRERELRQW